MLRSKTPSNRWQAPVGVRLMEQHNVLMETMLHDFLEDSVYDEYDGVQTSELNDSHCS